MAFGDRFLQYVPVTGYWGPIWTRSGLAHCRYGWHISTFGFVAEVVLTVGTPFQTSETFLASCTRDSDHAEYERVLYTTLLLVFSYTLHFFHRAIRNPSIFQITPTFDLRWLPSFQGS